MSPIPRSTGADVASHDTSTSISPATDTLLAKKNVSGNGPDTELDAVLRSVAIGRFACDHGKRGEPVEISDRGGIDIEPETR